jgi:signal transduction histidine kinase
VSWLLRRGGRRNLGLRARSAVAFALLGLTLSLVLSVVTYQRARVYLLDQRESVAVTQASLNAQLVANLLRSNSDDPLRVVAGASQPMLRRNGRWFVTAANISADDLPAPLRTSVAAGIPTRQRFALDGKPYMAVAIPLTASRANPTVYVEVTGLSELERTLAALGAALVAGSVIATALGAILGLYASRRVMLPLGSIAMTSERIAEGELTARLDDTSDPDLARLVGSFNRMAASLEQRIQREHRFTSHVSHELRSPLTSLRAAVDLVNTRQEDLPERARLGIGLIETQVKRFERMVLDLLEVAKIEAGVASTDLVPLRVEPLLRTTLARLQSDTPRELTPQSAGAVVLVDARRFEHVMLNLIENANAHGQGATAVRAELVGRRVAIHVDDAGPGVTPAERPHIFEPFIRGANGRHLPGAGLGLALVTEHMRLMSGTVCVGESPEGGARFTLELPKQDA